MTTRRRFLRLAPRALGLLGAVGGLTLAAADAHAESCADVATFVIPAVTVDDDAGQAVVTSAVPIDVQPLVLLDHVCSGAPPEVAFTLRRTTDDVVIDATVEERGTTDWSEYALAIEQPLDPSTQHELCFEANILYAPACVTFTTTDGGATSPTAPTLTVHAVETISGDTFDFAEVDAEVSWSTFPGAVWLEGRGSRIAPTVLSTDASAEESARGVGYVGIGDDDQLCLVAVALGANGERVESEPSCSDVGGCSIGAAPGHAGGPGLALALAVVGGTALTRRRRGR